MPRLESLTMQRQPRFATPTLDDIALITSVGLERAERSAARFPILRTFKLLGPHELALVDYLCWLSAAPALTTVDLSGVYPSARSADTTVVAQLIADCSDLQFPALTSLSVPLPLWPSLARVLGAPKLVSLSIAGNAPDGEVKYELAPHASFAQLTELRLDILVQSPTIRRDMFPALRSLTMHPIHAYWIVGERWPLTHLHVLGMWQLPHFDPRVVMSEFPALTNLTLDWTGTGNRMAGTFLNPHALQFLTGDCSIRKLTIASNGRPVMWTSDGGLTPAATIRWTRRSSAQVMRELAEKTSYLASHSVVKLQVGTDDDAPDLADASSVVQLLAKFMSPDAKVLVGLNNQNFPTETQQNGVIGWLKRKLSPSTPVLAAVDRGSVDPRILLALRECAATMG
ncbi:hypothetical protein H9P43_002317 [Blastocladiella emersonii ATCC 22665]|nr:hypothetical protein H9P43_002317 [Blastocladiella emersonii ATCC 22665]